MKKDDIQSELKQRLEQFREVPPRDTQAAARGRARFLAQAAAMRPVTSRPNRPAGMYRFAWKTVGVILMLLALLLGSSVSTALAARNALPDEMLYPVKTFSEDVRLNFARGAQSKISLLLQFSDTRLAEMNALAARGRPVPLITVTRCEMHLAQMFQLASGLDDETLLPVLEMIHARLAVQEQELQGLGIQDENILGLQQRMHEQMGIVEEGVRNPGQFRRRVRSGAPGNPVPQQEPSITTTPTPQGNGPNAGNISATEQSAGPGATQTPGSSHGPGPRGTPGNKGNRP